MTNRRNTIQKDLVRNAVYEMRRHVTANEVYEFIKEAYIYYGRIIFMKEELRIDIVGLAGALSLIHI